MSTDAQAVPDGLTPLNPDVQRCPYDWYQAMHSSGEGAFDAGPLGYVVSGHAEISEITFNTTGFSSEFYGPDGPQLAGVSPEAWSTEVQEFWAALPKLKNALFCCDPPTQTRQKAIANKSMNIGRVRAMEPTIRAEANALIDAVISDGRCNFFDAYASPLPVIMIATMLGMDGERLLFKKWSDHIADGYLAPMNNEARMEVLRSAKDFMTDLLPLPDGSAFSVIGLRQHELPEPAPMPIAGWWTDGTTLTPLVGGQWHKEATTLPLRYDLEFANGHRIAAEFVRLNGRVQVAMQESEPGPEAPNWALAMIDMFSTLRDADGNEFPVFSEQGFTHKVDVLRSAQFIHAGNPPVKQ